MKELIINLDGVNLIALWGAQNENFVSIQERFPKLRLIARGTELKVLGEPNDQELFEQLFSKITDHVSRNNILDTL